MSFDCTCHIGPDGKPTVKRQLCGGHIGTWCGCGNECPCPPLDLGRNAAKRERRKRKGKR